MGVGLNRRNSIYASSETYLASVPPALRGVPGLAFEPLSIDRPNILVIGDSISIGYMPSLRLALADVAAVLHVPDNASSTRYTRERLDQWLDDRDWDVIYANWGLHDLRVDATTGHAMVPPKTYRDNLEWLLDQLAQRTLAPGTRNDDARSRGCGIENRWL